MRSYLVTTSATDVELPTSAGKRIDGEDQEPDERFTYLSLSAGVDGRLRVAHHQRMDLIGIMWVFAENKPQAVQPTEESTPAIRTEGLGGSLEVGVGVEWWNTGSPPRSPSAPTSRPRSRAPPGCRTTTCTRIRCGSG